MNDTGSKYTALQIAQVCHEANRALQDIDSDPSPSQPWAAETDETRRTAHAGVHGAIVGITPERLHEVWVRDKAKNGWVFGPVKDPQAKTHPRMVPYAELPEAQRTKDTVFAAIVTAMTGACR